MADDYHHGDLRQALLTEAEQALATIPADQLSLRDLARRAGVSHAAPAHHFGDRRGLLVALALDGHGRLGAALHAASEGGLADLATAYVRFAVEHPGLIAIMYRPDLADPEIVEARATAGTALRRELATADPTLDPDRLHARVLAAWSFVHGLALLISSGAVQGPPSTASIARELAALVRPTVD